MHACKLIDVDVAAEEGVLGHLVGVDLKRARGQGKRLRGRKHREAFVRGSVASETVKGSTGGSHSKVRGQGLLCLHV